MNALPLEPGYRHVLKMQVSSDLTVPNLFAETTEFSAFPEVLATGFMVAAMELACVQALHPKLPPGWGSLRIGIDVTHEAATPPGMEISIEAVLEAVDGRKALFAVEARDGVDIIGRGRHRRAAIDLAKFEQRIAQKRPGV